VSFGSCLTVNYQTNKTSNKATANTTYHLYISSQHWIIVYTYCFSNTMFKV